jgi:hypothetical protein
MVLGKDASARDNGVIVELKQWEECREGYGDKVVTRTGGAMRDVLHPSVQVGQYKMYLQDSHTAFYEGVQLAGAYHGAGAISSEWLDTLAKRELLEDIGTRLHRAGQAG